MSDTNSTENRLNYPFKEPEANQSPGFLLWKMTTLWQEKLSVVFKKNKMTQTQYAIMASIKWLVWQNTQQLKPKPITQAVLVLHTKIDKMTISKSIRSLEAKGYTQKVVGVDKRSNEVRLTQTGERFISQVIAQVEQVDDLFFSKINSEQLRILKKLMLDLSELNYF